MIRRVCLVCALTLGVSSGAVHAAEDGAALAGRAAAMLAEAGERLSGASGAPDRIAALTETVRAYEIGLAALRAGLRQTAMDQKELSGRLGGEDAELGALLSMLQSVSRTSRTEALLHPGTAPSRVRAGMLTASLVPALQERATGLAEELRELDELASIRRAGIATLESGMADIRTARLALAKAISERTDLPIPLATDEAALEALINSAETLAAFADSLGSDEAPALAERDWQMPVLGEVIRTFREKDAAGIARPGWIIETSPLSLVTAPTAATVRFAGPMPGHGNVAILEPAARTLIVIAGLDEPLVRRRQVLEMGDPIGLMGGMDTSAQENLIEKGADSGQFHRETLYMEIRQAEVAVDPADFLMQIGNKDRE